MKIKKEKQKTKFIEAIGRRKEAVARVRIFFGVESVDIGGNKLKKGDFFINGLPFDTYFKLSVERKILIDVLKVVENKENYLINVLVKGGGKKGQIDAVVLGLARAFSKLSDDLRKKFRSLGYLTCDSRVKQRRKVGTGGKARRKKQSPKR